MDIECKQSFGKDIICIQAYYKSYNYKLIALSSTNNRLQKYIDVVGSNIILRHAIDLTTGKSRVAMRHAEYNKSYNDLGATFCKLLYVNDTAYLCLNLSRNVFPSGRPIISICLLYASTVSYILYKRNIYIF